jgi:hypothetical protein
MNKNIGLFGAVFAIFYGVSTNSVFASCHEFPEYRLWNTLNHDSVKKYVDRKLKGNWSPYISHLEGQIERIEKIVASGKGSRLKHNGEIVILTGENLAQYYRLSQARLEVVQCLASEANDAPVKMARMVGVNEEDDDVEVEVAPAKKVRAAMKIEVNASCSSGVSTFKVKNNGADWPRSGSFSIFRLDGKQMYPVSNRRMRLKRGQSASFSVKKMQNPTGRIGLFVNPSWYTRSFVQDASLTCS